RLRAFAGCMATSNLASTAFFALYILFGTRELHLTAAQLGLVYGIGAAGSMLAAIAAPRLTARWGIGRVLLLGALLGSAEVLPVVFANPANAVALLIFSSLLGNFGWVVYNINAISVRQSVVSPELLGRVNASMGFLMAGMLPVGALLGGLLGQALGLRATITLAAVGSLLSAGWILFSPVPGILSIEKTGG
ncbi:MAG: MFS transporter, partial [Anaerolineaceae bacterium]